jgi:imidazoleglycerol-phosphate dehydratase
MERKAEKQRKTGETTITVSLNLDGTGKRDIHTGVGFLDHMLEQLALHSLTDMSVTASGDLDVDDHHTVEDVAICLGEAMAEALGAKEGIFRYGEAKVPMDDALAEVAVDFSGRVSLVWRVKFLAEKIGRMDTQLFEEFFRALASSARMNLHVSVPYGANDHHIAEAVFKAVAMAVRKAKAADPDRGGSVPSTKGDL